MTSERPVRLLLIDDDDLSREVIALVLSEDGFTLSPFPSGEAALAYLAANASAFDAVLSDLQMPGLSGNVLATALRENSAPGTPILVMSASSPSPSTIAAFDGFLSKPFTAADLRALLAASPVHGHASPTSHVIDLAASAESDEPSPGVSDVANPILDERIFSGLGSLMSPAQLRELVELCFAEITRHTRAMHSALEDNDPAAFRNAAHALKGGVAMVGARELQHLAALLESAAPESANQMASLYEIPAATERLRRILGTRGIELPPGPVAQGDATE